MADIRSLLRSELASRKDQPSSKPLSKKRKAAAEAESGPSNAKKSRSVSSEDTQSTRKTAPLRQTAHVASPPELETVPEEEIDTTTAEPVPAPADSEEAQAIEQVDEDEWAAFERDVATPPPDAVPKSALYAPAAIEAKAMTAAELAAQAREVESEQRGKRDIEAEEEKDEAARRLEEEFDDMEVLEDRVKRLRERREALRRGSETGGNVDMRTTQDEAPGNIEVNINAQAQVTDEATEQLVEKGEDDEEGEDDSDEEADDNDWLWRR